MEDTDSIGDFSGNLLQNIWQLPPQFLATHRPECQPLNRMAGGERLPDKTARLPRS
jgi:hypothetical protein